MDEYIYIIGGIAYLAYSIYSGTKKKNAAVTAKKKAVQDSVENDESEASTEDFNIEKLFGFESLQAEVENLPYEVIEENQVEKEGAFYQSQVTDEIKPVKKIYDEKVDRQTDNILVEEENEEKEEFDLKQAIIYSEILNPPYIQK